MISRRGSGMVAVAPVASTPLRIVRRSKVFVAIGSTVRLGLRCDGRKRVVRDDGEHQIRQLETGSLERRSQRVEYAPVHVTLLVAHGVAIVLSHQTLGDGGALAGGDA